MKNEWQNSAQDLEVVLETPKQYIDTSDLKDGETYVWFPTSGNSMTDDTIKSIPGGSLVLGRWLKLNNVLDIPLQRPIVVIIDDNGTQYCMLKSFCKVKYCSHEVDAGSEMLCLRSYNPDPKYDDFWIPYSCIKFVFVVERVKLPEGNEFVPKQDEVIKKGRY